MSVTKEGLVISSNYNNDDVFNGVYADGSFFYVSVAMTVTKKKYYTNYRIEIEKPTSNTWYTWRTISFPFEIGSAYLWKSVVRCNECTAGISASMRASRATNDWVTNMVVIASPTLADGKWHEYNRTQVINSTFERSGTTVTSAPVFEIYTSNLSTATTDTLIMDFDIYNIQVVKSDVDLPVDAFYEIDDNPFGIGSDFVRTTKIYEI